MAPERTLGYYWLPNPDDGSGISQLPDRRVAGTLITADEGPWRLDLLESLLPSDHLRRHGYQNAYPRMSAIHGFSSRNNALCLFDTWRSSFSMFSALLNQETWHVGWYTEGDAWIGQEDIVRSVRVEYDSLWEWATFGERVGLEYDIEERTARLPAPEQHRMEIRGAELITRLDWEQVYSPYGYNARPSAVIEIAQDLPLYEVRDRWILPLQMFLRFLTLQFVDIERVIACPPDIDAGISLHYNLFRPSASGRDSDLDLGSRALATPGYLSARGLRLDSVLSAFLDLIEDDDHRSALWLLNESKDRLLDKSIDAAFLNIFRSMERYHAAAIGGTEVPRSQHRARVRAVVKNSPEEHQEWVREQLARANKKTQQRQLQDVLEHATDTASRITESWPGFFESIVDLRGRVAHGIPQTSGEAALGYRAATTGLQWIMGASRLRSE